WAAVLCRGGIEWKNRGAGCGGMSTDVWGFAEAGAGVDCGRKAGSYGSSGRVGGLRSKRGAGFAREKIDPQRHSGGDHGERDDAVRGCIGELCAESRCDNGDDYVEPADAGGTAGENRDCSGGGAGSGDGIDAFEGGD